MSTRKRDAETVLESMIGGPLTLGGALSAIRQTEGYTLAQLAERLEVSRSHLCDIERSRRSVSLERAARFAKALKHNPTLFVQLALQDQIRQAGLKMKVRVEAA